MCKLFMVPNITDSNREKVMELTQNMATVMSTDLSHRDGTGYAGVDSKGNLFGERWLNPDDAFAYSEEHEEQDESIVKNTLQKWAGFLYNSVKQKRYNRFGDVNLEDIKSITLHTRLATSEKGLQNCHPFVKSDTSLVHNGVISNHTKFKKEVSSCDSESILTSYLNNRVYGDVRAFNNSAEELVGYYAFGIYSRDLKGNRVLDIGKCIKAELISAYIKEIDCVVFASKKDQLIEGCELSGLTISAFFDVVPSSIVRVNPLTGDIISKSIFVNKQASTVTTNIRHSKKKMKKLRYSRDYIDGNRLSSSYEDEGRYSDIYNYNNYNQRVK